MWIYLLFSLFPHCTLLRWCVSGPRETPGPSLRLLTVLALPSGSQSRFDVFVFTSPPIQRSQLLSSCGIPSVSCTPILTVRLFTPYDPDNPFPFSHCEFDKGWPVPDEKLVHSYSTLSCPVICL